MYGWAVGGARVWPTLCIRLLQPTGKLPTRPSHPDTYPARPACCTVPACCGPACCSSPTHSARPAGRGDEPENGVQYHTCMRGLAHQDGACAYHRLLATARMVVWARSAARAAARSLLTVLACQQSEGVHARMYVPSGVVRYALSMRCAMHAGWRKHQPPAASCPVCVSCVVPSHYWDHAAHADGQQPAALREEVVRAFSYQSCYLSIDLPKARLDSCFTGHTHTHTHTHTHARARTCMHAPYLPAACVLEPSTLRSLTGCSRAPRRHPAPAPAPASAPASKQ